jgi:hypothetical protein
MDERSIVTRQARAEAVAHSHGLRAQLHHGLELLTDDHPLCQWNGPLLPLETIDRMTPIVHGTSAGWRKHHAYGIPPCADCIAANREYRRTLDARKKAS